jgi:hypothetical protein
MISDTRTSPNRARPPQSARRRLTHAALAVIACVLPLAAARAQSDDRREITLHRVLPFENARDPGGDRALALRVLYSVQNKRAQAVEKADAVTGATLRLEPERVFAQPSKDEAIGEGQWNIVLLTDFTDAGAQDDTRNLMQARKDLATELEGLKDGDYAWFDFNDKLIERQEKFKPLKPQEDPSKKNDPNGAGGQEKKDDSIPALLAKPSTPPASKPACLNRALADGINKLKEVPGGRKAIIVLAHQIDGCPQLSSRDEVIAAARDEKADGQQVQIFAIGLGGESLKRELDQLTTPTGGAAFVSDINGMIPAMRGLRDLIAGQREATFVLYPRNKGVQKGVYRVLLADGTSKDGALTFNSALTYAAPASLLYDRHTSLPEGLRIFFRTVSRENIKRFVLRLVDPDTGATVDEFNRPGTNLTCNDENLCFVTLAPKDKGGPVEPNKTYEIQGFFEVRDNERKPIFDSDATNGGRNVTAQYLLQPPVLSAKSLSPSIERRSFVVTVTADIDRTAVQVLLISRGTTGQDTIISEQGPELLDKNTPKQFTFAAGELPDGVYSARAVWADSPSVAVEADAMTLDSESALERLVREAQRSSFVRILLIAIAAVAVLGIIGVILYFRSRSVSQVRMVRGEGIGQQRMRKIQIEADKRGKPAPDFTRPPEAAQDKPRQSAPPSESARPAAAAVPPKAEAQRPPTQPAQLPPASIRVSKPANIAFKGRVKKSPFVLGRDPNNDGALPVDASSGVSRKHATLVFEDAAWRIRDEGASNGVSVDGARVPAHGNAPLRDGSRIVLGSIELEFRLH